MTELTNIEVLQALKDGKRVEFQDCTGNWIELDNFFRIGVLIDDDVKFRIRPNMITVGDVSFPLPERKWLRRGTEYFVANPTFEGCATYWHWSDDELDERYLAAGLVHLTKENAVAHAKALIKLSGGRV